MNPEGSRGEQDPIVTYPELSFSPDANATSDDQPKPVGWDEYATATLVDGKKLNANGDEVHYPWHLTNS